MAQWIRATSPKHVKLAAFIWPVLAFDFDMLLLQQSVVCLITGQGTNPSWGMYRGQMIVVFSLSLCLSLKPVESIYYSDGEKNPTKNVQIIQKAGKEADRNKIQTTGKQIVI